MQIRRAKFDPGAVRFPKDTERLRQIVRETVRNGRLVCPRNFTGCRHCPGLDYAWGAVKAHVYRYGEHLDVNLIYPGRFYGNVCHAARTVQFPDGDTVIQEAKDKSVGMSELCSSINGEARKT